MDRILVLEAVMPPTQRCEVVRCGRPIWEWHHVIRIRRGSRPVATGISAGAVARFNESLKHGWRSVDGRTDIDDLTADGIRKDSTPRRVNGHCPCSSSGDRPVSLKMTGLVAVT